MPGTFGSQPYTTELAVSGTAGASGISAGGPLEDMVRRLIGEGAINLRRARAEVHAALDTRGGTLLAPPQLADVLPPETIPSVAAGCQEDRLLAEIDQDGFAFAADPVDEPFFNRRARRVPKQRNRIDVALVDGRVCIRKRSLPLRLGARFWGDRRVSAAHWAQDNLWAALGLFMYSEAAALLRLQDLPFVPKLRGIDIRTRTLYLDYIPGEDLRYEAARGGAAVHDCEVKDDRDLRQLSAMELQRREFQLLDHAGGGDLRREIADMARHINARGVVPLEIKLGNFVRGAATRKLYWVDFEFCRLESQPRWERDLLGQQDILDYLFQLHGPAWGRAPVKTSKNASIEGKIVGCSDEDAQSGPLPGMRSLPGAPDGLAR